MCTYCGSGFILIMCVHSCTNKIDTEIKGHVEGVKHSSIYTIRAAMLCMSKVSKVHTGLSIQSNVTHVKGVESSLIYTIRAVMLYMSKVSKKFKMVLHIFAYNFFNFQPIFNPKKF